ncbi:hypothetical protein ACWCOW_37885 [Streptomyces sp. NPDC001939]
MDSLKRQRALQRAHAIVRKDEAAAGIFGFDVLLVVIGDQVVPRPGGAVGITDRRILVVQEDGRERPVTSLSHSSVLGAQLQEKFMKPSVVTINAGQMGITALTGPKGPMKRIAALVNTFAGSVVELESARLMPDPNALSLCCSGCGHFQQDEWNLHPEYCHICMRTFTWTDRRRELVGELKAFLASGAPASAKPQHLWEWGKHENPDWVRQHGFRHPVGDFKDVGFP